MTTSEFIQEEIKICIMISVDELCSTRMVSTLDSLKDTTKGSDRTRGGAGNPYQKVWVARSSDFSRHPHIDADLSLYREDQWCFYSESQLTNLKNQMKTRCSN